MAGERDRLAVVAGARGDDARGGSSRLQRSDQVQAAANLERAGRVVVLVLDVHVGVERVGEQRMRQQRRRLQRAVDELAGGTYVCE